ncbi:Heterokaryon incompatibility protein 6, OR allele [Madurella mycetomatis]|uniref:Heterokaryon incompatibility protein 6, OR allele n=1 Tax=Madurella mycetomatis TaxID=100816 RepID=A0A175VV25_9PEZI|nr:Heterokaryon incompatibility protein 6, OR allele [Madurella mycetomatis]
MEDWNGSHSDGASLEFYDDDEAGMNLDSEDAESELLPGTAVHHADEGMAGEAGRDNSGVELGDATGDATSVDDSRSEKPGFHTIQSLNCTARLDLTVEFLRWRDSSVFNLVKITIEVTTSDRDDCPLREMVGENAVIITLEVICTGEGKNRSLALAETPVFFNTNGNKDTIDGASVFPRHWEVVSAASFDEWVPRAQTWLRACKEHVSCTTSGVFQPTRLINVRNPQHPRLAIFSAGDFSRSGVPPPYVALSYVWGPKQEYVLTQTSLDEMRRGLDLKRLPRTLSDAIEAAHWLGFEYLWIDALCIIQDSLEDKAKELPLMADTYRESSLSIIVASATAASDGFLKAPDSPEFLVDPFQVRLGSVDGSSTLLTFGYRAPYKASADPISSRAWTLQERVLSRRLLVFSRRGVMWICRETFANPSAAPDAGPPYQTSLGLSPEAGDGSDEDAWASIRGTWMAIRADYTEMDLSYCTDKLPAISALAAEVGRLTGWAYLAGMWEDNLFSELHWRSTKRGPSGETLVLKPQKARGIGYLAPSWSWASVGLGGIVDSEDERAEREVFHFTILACHVDSDLAFPFGLVKGGYLEVSGKALELAWQPGDRPSWDDDDISLIDPGGSSDSTGTPLLVGDGTLDPLDEHLDPGLRLVCLGMSKLRLGRQRTVPVEGLILVPNGPGSSAFRRIGFFRMTAPSVFDGVATRILRIE